MLPGVYVKHDKKRYDVIKKMAEFEIEHWLCITWDMSFQLHIVNHNRLYHLVWCGKKKIRTREREREREREHIVISPLDCN